ncbi:MAG: crossover junction endodeoxyribonuclease RuvC [Gammaproteobacteria bacterium]|nr:crossover junction endodeoxyribonuclease RuvC [Gammaproteobacteria bacterium]MCI0590782.1 crossover junction endodeoxyribonuclease RuvC [Gammaproteobacteria bacterium]
MTRILGIDPGSQVTGYGIIDMAGPRATHVANGSIRVRDEELGAKLRAIFEKIRAIAGDFQPNEVSVERLFMHRNADSALKLGQARGAAIVACLTQSLPIYEYTPTEIKQAIVGKGNAAKAQVQHMIKVLLCLKEAPQADAADALAIALGHGYRREGLLRMPGVRGIRGGRFI